MANRKITDLTELTTPASDDVIPIVDVSETSNATKNKKITAGNLLQGTPSLSLQLANGTQAAPSLAFTSATSTGLYRSAANELSIATNGGQAIKVEADNKTTIYGDLVVTGGTTTISSTQIDVNDKNLQLATGNSSDSGADGGGLTVKGASDKTWNWVDSTDAWTANQHIDVTTGKVYKIAGTEVLNATTLGSGVVSSSLTSVGTLGSLTVTNAVTAGSLDISGGADIDGTLEADAYTVNGTALNEYIADTVGAMVSSNTETNITVTYDDADNTLDFVIGTLNQDTTGNAATATALETARTIGGVSFNGTANINLPGVNQTGNQNTTGSAATLTTARTIGGVSFDGSANINLPGVNAAGNQNTSGTAAGLSGTPNITVADVIGASLDISGNADIDGTLEADAITVDGTALNEFIADTVGAMVSSNTESDIVVTYQDSDNTLDFTVSNISGTSGGLSGTPNITVGVVTGGSLDISGDADIDGTLEADAYTVNGTALNEYIADTVGAMVSSNTETNIAVTYDDTDNTLDFSVVNITGNAASADTVDIASLTNDSQYFLVLTDNSGSAKTVGIDSGLEFNPSTNDLSVPGSITTTGNLDINSTYPRINLTDSNNNPNWSIINNNGILGFYDNTNGAYRVNIQADGHVDVGHLDVGNALDVTGNITVTGTVDGRDIATDGTKLDTVETNAKDDQTAAEIKTLLNSNGIVNAQVDASAAIAGTKISPDFGSQNVVTTGTLSAGQTTLSHSTAPQLILKDSDTSGVGDVNGISLQDSGGTEYGFIGQTETGGHSLFIKTVNTTNPIRLQVNSSTILEVGNTGAYVTGLLSVTGNIGVSGTVDGVDIATRDTLFGGLTSSSGALTDGVTATTQSASDNSTKVATTAYTDTAISNLIDSSPGTLNTLNELAAALGDDANFSTTVTNSIATKLPLAGGTLTGDTTLANTKKVIFNHSSGAGAFIKHQSGHFEIISSVGNTYFAAAGTLYLRSGGNTNALTLDTSQNATFAGTVTATSFSGSGASITALNASNISSGTIAAARVPTLNQDTTGTAAGLTGTPNITVGVVTAASLDISGNVDVDGTLETDALTIDGVSLAETIADTVGAMVGSNTETGITVTYDDSDNTLDFVVGTLNQSTTGNAATATALATARTINGVSFDGTGNITVTAAAGTLSGNTLASGVTASSLTSVGTLTGLSVSGDILMTGTGAIDVPTGTTAQRPGSPTTGAFRYNSTDAQFEGYTASGWGAIAGGGGGGASDFQYLALRNSANNGAASYPASDFTLVTSGTSNAISPTAANTLLVSIGGVIQQPNTGTSTPTTGFAISGSTIKFGSNISAAPDFIIYQLGAGIGTPSDNTITSAKIVDGAIVNADINASAAIAGSKIVPTFNTNITVENTSPAIQLTDTDHNSDFNISASAGNFVVRDTTNGQNRIVLASDGTLDIQGNLDANSGIDVTGTLNVYKTGANSKILLSRNESVGTDNTEIGVIDFANNTAHTVNARIMAKTSGTGNVGGQLVVETRDPSNSTLAERLRIDSKGRVLIGCDSSSYAYSNLVVEGNATFDAGTGALQLQLGSANPSSQGSGLGEIRFTDSNEACGAVIKAESDAAWSNGSSYPSYLSFQTTAPSATSSTERLRIDSTGALGVGITPKANDTNYRHLQLGLGGNIYGRDDDTPLYLGSNVYRNSSNWKYAANTTATQIRLSTAITFQTAASGTADNNISFSEKLRIQNTGGISFNGDTAAANALSDYEQGSWTPSVTSGITSPGYSVQYGRYTKVGNLVTVWFYISLDGTGTANSSNFIVSGLPYTVTSTMYTAMSGYNNTSTSSFTNMRPIIFPGTTYIRWYFQNGTHVSGAIGTNLGASAAQLWWGSYQAS